MRHSKPSVYTPKKPLQATPSPSLPRLASKLGHVRLDAVDLKENINKSNAYTDLLKPSKTKTKSRLPAIPRLSRMGMGAPKSQTCAGELKARPVLGVKTSGIDVHIVPADNDSRFGHVSRGRLHEKRIRTGDTSISRSSTSIPTRTRMPIPTQARIRSPLSRSVNEGRLAPTDETEDEVVDIPRRTPQISVVREENRGLASTHSFTSTPCLIPGIAPGYAVASARSDAVPCLRSKNHIPSLPSRGIEAQDGYVRTQADRIDRDFPVAQEDLGVGSPPKLKPELDTRSHFAPRNRGSLSSAASSPILLPRPVPIPRVVPRQSKLQHPQQQFKPTYKLPRLSELSSLPTQVLDHTPTKVPSPPLEDLTTTEYANERSVWTMMDEMRLIRDGGCIPISRTFIPDPKARVMPLYMRRHTGCPKDYDSPNPCSPSPVPPEYEAPSTSKRDRTIAKSISTPLMDRKPIRGRSPATRDVNVDSPFSFEDVQVSYHHKHDYTPTPAPRHISRDEVSDRIPGQLNAKGPGSTWAFRSDATRKFVMAHSQSIANFLHTRSLTSKFLLRGH